MLVLVLRPGDHYNTLMSYRKIFVEFNSRLLYLSVSCRTGLHPPGTRPALVLEGIQARLPCLHAQCRSQGYACQRLLTALSDNGCPHPLPRMQHLGRAGFKSKSSEKDVDVT